MKLSSLRRPLGFAMLAAASVSFLAATSSSVSRQDPPPPATTQPVKVLKKGLSSPIIALDLEDSLPSATDIERFSSNSWVLAVDGPMPDRSHLRITHDRSKSLVSSLRAGWVRAFSSVEGVVSVSVLLVSPSLKPVSALPQEMSVTLSPKDKSPLNLPLPQADWLSFSPGEIILKRGEFVVWVRSSKVSIDRLSSIASSVAQKVSLDATSREDGKTPPPSSSSLGFDIPEILPYYPDRDTRFPVSDGVCIVFDKVWYQDSCKS